jgi:hypothetical protein
VAERLDAAAVEVDIARDPHARELLAARGQLCDQADQDRVAGNTPPGLNHLEPGDLAEVYARLWVPIIRPCWSGSMPVLVEGAAEPVLSADIEVRDPLRISNRSG